MEEQTNVFDAISSYFDSVPLINIEHQTTFIEVPFIPLYDINRYDAYIAQWIERNEIIIEQRKNMQVTSTQLEEIGEAFGDGNEAENMEQVIDKMNTVVNNVKRNYVTIQRYGDLPDKINQWLR
jgi:hypothetical protein